MERVRQKRWKEDEKVSSVKWDLRGDDWKEMGEREKNESQGKRRRKTERREKRQDEQSGDKRMGELSCFGGWESWRARVRGGECFSVSSVLLSACRPTLQWRFPLFIKLPVAPSGSQDSIYITFNMLSSAALCPSKGDGVRISGINPWGLPGVREEGGGGGEAVDIVIELKCCRRHVLQGTFWKGPEKNKKMLRNIWLCLGFWLSRFNGPLIWEQRPIMHHEFSEVWSTVYPPACCYTFDELMPGIFSQFPFHKLGRCERKEEEKTQLLSEAPRWYKRRIRCSIRLEVKDSSITSDW